MTQGITLRLITRQAGGGEIIRTRHIEGAEAMIGRAPDCDIYLPDLAVDRQHAMLRVTGQNRVTIESLTGQPFIVDGQPTLKVELEVIRGPVVTFGSFDLLFGQGGEGDIAVTVMRKEDARAQGVGLFSLRAAMFGRRRMAWTLGLAIVALCLIVPLAGTSLLKHARIHPDRQWSSGPLSKAHQFLENDCQACHQKAFVSVRDEACLTCHKTTATPQATLALNASLKARGSPFIPRLIDDHAVHDRLLRGTPMPPSLGGKASAMIGRAFNHPNDRCASCHLEHTKPAGPIAAADRPQRPTLVVTNDCASCHARLKMRLPDTTLIDTPDWSRHPAFRPVVTLAAGPHPQFERIALTAHPQERSGLVFSHRQHLDPAGGVARMGLQLGAGRGYGGALACASCHHPKPGGAQWEPIRMERDCGACHSLAFAAGGGEARLLPHGDVRKVMETLSAFYGGRIGGGAAPETGRRLPGQFRLQAAGPRAPSSGAASGLFRAAFSPGGACYGCHAISWDGDGPMGVKVAPVHLTARFMPRGAFDHSTPAHGGQALGGAACNDCHKAQTSDATSDVMLPDIGKCASCHGQPKAKVAAAASAECTECHSFHHPGRATPNGQDRLFEAIFAPTGAGPARGMPGA
ncbi:MAG: hypothetical protein JWQ29_30 [Phenylobacterium sp.]|nr:hypothetical protein [Phenylobacterium sp.]